MVTRNNLCPDHNIITKHIIAYLVLTDLSQLYTRNIVVSWPYMGVYVTPPHILKMPCFPKLPGGDAHQPPIFWIAVL